MPLHKSMVTDVKQRKLTELELDNFDEDAIKELVELLREHDNVSKLTLSQADVSLEIAQQLKRLLSNTRRLATLSIVDIALTTEVIAILAEAIRANSTLKYLSFWNCQLGVVGVQQLKGAIFDHQQLEDLELWGNAIGNEGAALLADALEHNHHLLHLRLANNHIEDEGVTHIAHALSHNQTLLTLDLWDNAITAKGLVAIAEGLKQNHSLSKLELRGNQIGESADAATALITLLQSLHAIAQLNLSNNQLTLNSDANAKKVINAINASCCLIELDLSENKIPSPILKEIDVILRPRLNITDKARKSAYEILRVARILAQANRDKSHNLVRLPEDMLAYILKFLDKRYVLAQGDTKNIFAFAKDKTTLGRSKEFFLKYSQCDAVSFFSRRKIASIVSMQGRENNAKQSQLRP